MNTAVNFYFDKAGKWQKEIKKLRAIVLDCGLVEELKWGVPCYAFAGDSSKKNSNVVLIHVFKEYCALLFFKGALMKNEHGLLIQQTANVQAARQIRFTQASEIIEQEPVLKACIFEAIEIEKSGEKIALKQTEEFEMPEEFSQKLSAMPELKLAFHALTPGRQRSYKMYFSAPKQFKTRLARIEKCVPQILLGKGLND